VAGITGRESDRERDREIYTAKLLETVKAQNGDVEDIAKLTRELARLKKLNAENTDKDGEDDDSGDSDASPSVVGKKGKKKGEKTYDLSDSDASRITLPGARPRKEVVVKY